MASWILISIKIFQPKTRLPLPRGSDLAVIDLSTNMSQTCFQINSVLQWSSQSPRFCVKSVFWPEYRSPHIQTYQYIKELQVSCMDEWLMIPLQVSPTLLDITGRDSVYVTHSRASTTNTSIVVVVIVILATRFYVLPCLVRPSVMFNHY